jgi:hypothetical protein
VSGRIQFQRVPFRSPTVVNPGVGLDFPSTFTVPARSVVVELLNASSRAVIATTTTDDDGNYSFTTTPSTGVIVRAKAQTRRVTPGWDIRVMNNTNGNALYVLDSSSFNTGTANVTRNLTAETGWPGFGGTNYSGPRSAAPFAILDTLRSAAEYVRTNGDPAVGLPALDVYWSTQNRPSNNFNPPAGDVQSTLFRSGSTDGFADGIYVLGLANTDTDEFDQHVLAHEFQHFLEDAISRTETPGGSHSLGERLDLRLAFSEGFANAFSGMVLNDPIYKDSFGQSQGSRFDFNLESNAQAPAGWFNEGSIHSLVWDLFDATNEAPDNVTLGYGPLFDVLTGELRTGPALTSFYPFITALRAAPGAPVGAIDALVPSQQIFGTGVFAIGETNAGNTGGNTAVAGVLPIYNPLTLDGGAQRVCGTTQAGTFNAIGNRLFLRFSLVAAQTVTIRAVYTATGSQAGGPTPDPDIVLYRNGFLAIAETTTANQEELTRELEAGEYVVEVYEYSHIDDAAGTNRRGVTCMNVSVTG